MGHRRSATGGYESSDLETVEMFPREFQEGMASGERPRVLGDTGDSDPTKWDIGAPQQGDMNLPIWRRWRCFRVNSRKAWRAVSAPAFWATPGTATPQNGTSALRNRGICISSCSCMPTMRRLWIRCTGGLNRTLKQAG